MLFDGQTIKLDHHDGELAELRFERANEAVNKLDVLTFGELRRALDSIAASPAIRGVLITSAKDAFIVGADIFEFTSVFKRPEKDIEAFVGANSKIITALSDLLVPTVAAINGLALGGGLEVALAADYRVMSSAAKIGFPEISLGLFPGYGGTVRLPRLTGLGPSAEWIVSGAQQSAERALQAGAVDAVAAPEELRAAALAMLKMAVDGKAGWQGRRRRMKQGLGIAKEEAASLLANPKAQAANALPHLPAAHFAVDLLEKASGLDRNAALALEAGTFAKVAKTQAASSLVTIFVNEQAVKKSIRRYAKDVAPVRKAAVAGAGIMGGGIAYQSASRGVPIVMKDISAAALDLGMTEARKLLAKAVETGRLAQDKADAIIGSIMPSLTYEGFGGADVVVEAVVENLAVKQAVLREIEELVRAQRDPCLEYVVLADRHSRGLSAAPGKFFRDAFFQSRTENAAGRSGSLHQNVVPNHRSGHRLCAAMGKTPIVVGDCPGFAVNRALTPYIIAFLRLVRDGVDFQEIDKAMEAFGWPMGPAYLIDVIGMDISHHVVEIVSAGFAPRMDVNFETALEILMRDGRLGQKNGRGFYKYESDSKGRARREIDPEVVRLLVQRAT